jgi:hypothetical protein
MQREAQVDVRLGEHGPQPKRPLELGDRLGGLADVPDQVGVQPEGRRRVGAQGQGRRRMTEGLLVPRRSASWQIDVNAWWTQ